MFRRVIPCGGMLGCMAYPQSEFQLQYCRRRARFMGRPVRHLSNDQRDTSTPHALCPLPASLHCGFRLMLQ